MAAPSPAGDGEAPAIPNPNGPTVVLTALDFLRSRPVQPPPPPQPIPEHTAAAADSLPSPSQPPVPSPATAAPVVVDNDPLPPPIRTQGEGAKAARTTRTNFGKGEGALDVQTQAMQRHQRTTKHRDAIRNQELALAKAAGQHRIPDFPKARDVEHDAVEALLDTMLFITKTDAPIDMWV
ncbi:unnamed protein product [Closterium sp. Naga37s-1]|nr:unnamed protein product [Closterium sp. Naga37s-1]